MNGQHGIRRRGSFSVEDSFNAAFRPLDDVKSWARVSRLVIYFLHCITSYLDLISVEEHP